MLRTWLAGINPLVDVVLSEHGELTFGNAAVDAGVATQPRSYRATWSMFDNVTQESTRIGETSGTTARLGAPDGLPAAQGTYLHVEITAVDGPHPSWAVPVHAYFWRTATGWKLVGLDRL